MIASKKSTVLMLSIAAFIIGASANAADVYTCNGSGGQNDSRGSTVTLTVVSAKVVKVDEDRATLDENYHPRLNADFKRFEYDSSDEGVSEVLVQDKLLDGGRTGMIKIQNRGEGFGSSNYYCHR